VGSRKRVLQLDDFFADDRGIAADQKFSGGQDWRCHSV
jgi:hypothetical protein